MSIERGARVGPYTVANLIGVGGMGEVYRATDARLKRDVALKTLPATVADDVARLDRLQREAELLASLNHANIAHLYGIEREAGTTALVMELVEGPTLADRLARGALPHTEALEIALQIASALEAAHERGIVHRDLKPANIKFTADGTVKVLDFGIAKALELRTASGPPSQGGAAPVTEVGAVLGTAPYMAPEQARGQAVDKRVDIWSFGCVLYEMLTGEPAFRGDDDTTTLARVLERDPDFTSLPAGLAPAVRRTLVLCLQKDPRKRPRDIGDVRLALIGEFATPTEVQRPAWRYVLPAAVVVAVAILAGAYIVDAGRTPTAALGPPAPAPMTRFAFTPPATAPLASLSGYDVAVSPDGQRFVYFAESSQNGGVQLYLRELDELEARPLGSEMSAGNGALNPFFSPDGRSVLHGRPDGGLHRLFIDGAPPVKVADHRGGMIGGAWLSADTIVYSAGQVLTRVSAGGGAPQPLIPGREVRGISPAVLPGGAVMFGVPNPAGEDIHVIDLESGEQKELVPGGKNPTYLDTGHLVFVRDGALMAAPFDAAERTLTGEPVALLRVRAPAPNNATDYALSASGTLVYVPGGDENGGLTAAVWVDRRGEIVGRATDLAPFARDPRLAPDGRRLVLTTGLAGDADLWVYDLTGRPPLRLASAGNNRRAVWSPDSRRIAFETAGPDGGVFLIAADGSMLAPLPLRTEQLAGIVADWSLAGELLLVRAASGNPDIAAVAIDGDDGLRDIIATPYLEFDATWSPNGRWLAYVSDRSGQNEIWVQAYPDGVPVRVSPNTGFEPRWSADGRELFYLRGATMMAVAVNTTEDEFSFSVPERLFDTRLAAFPTAPNTSYDVARDGRFLMLEPQTEGDGARAESQIVVVQNFAEEVARRVPVRPAR